MGDERLNARTMAKRGVLSLWDEGVKGGAKELLLAVLAVMGGGGAVLGAFKAHWLVIVGAALAGGGIVFVLGMLILAIRENSRVRQLSSTAVPDAPQGALTLLVDSGRATQTVRAIGIVHPPQIRYDGTQAPPLFRCSCVIDFLAADAEAPASPHELLVTEPGTGKLLCQLATSYVLKGSGLVTYSGTADLLAMGWRIHNSGPKSIIAQLDLPIPDGTFCEVEVRLPIGTGLAMHGQSGVKLDMELEGTTAKRFVVRVGNVGAMSPPEPASKLQLVQISKA